MNRGSGNSLVIIIIEKVEGIRIIRHDAEEGARLVRRDFVPVQNMLDKLKGLP
jgi:hypothetical protein